LVWKNNDHDKTNSKKYEIDKMVLVEKMENTPLGQLRQDNKRDMLIVMHQLSSMGRRQDDLDGTSSKDGSYTRQRRQDATIVEQLLNRFLKEYQYSTECTNNDRQSNQNNLNARTYNLAIKAWANANVRGSAEKAERLLKRLKVANINWGKAVAPATSLQPDLYSFAYCYAAWYRESIFAARTIGNMKASSVAMRKAESVLQSMKQVLMEGNDLSQSLNIVEDVNSLFVMWSNTNIDMPDMSDHFLRFVNVESTGTNDTWLNTRSYNLVINAWAKSGSNHSINRAEALLDDMEKSAKVTPDVLSYSGVISCIAKSKRATDAKKAQNLLHRMTKVSGVSPDNVIFNQVMNIYCKRGSKGSADQCEKLLKQMELLSDEGNQQVAPNVRTYNILLSAYANEKGPLDAEKVLQRLEMHGSIKPNSISYTTVMDGYAKIGDAHNNLRILSLMQKSFEDGNAQAKPTRRAYVSALNSLAKSGRGDAGTRAEALVQTMEKISQAGNSDLKPDTTVYNVLINCHKNSAARAEKVLYRMGKRDVVSYSNVINVYSKMGGVKAATRAQALLDEMQKEQINPNAHTFNSAITAWSRSGSKGSALKAESLLKKMEELHEAGNKNLQPSAQVYTSVISAWAKSNDPGSALRAEILLKLMWAMYKRGNKSVKPNVLTFTSVISAWARSREKEAGEKAEALIDQMINLYENGHSDVRPNVLSFTSALHAYAQNGVRDGAQKGELLLKKMESIGVKPNLQTYNVLISLWGNSQQQGAGKKAESLLTKLEDKFRNGNKEMRPTVVSYTSCISAWAKSTDYGKAERASDVLKRMKEMYALGVISDRPNEFSYTAVINACATTYGEQGEKQEAFRIAYNAFKEMSESENLHPNHVTYSTFLRAISKLMPKGEKKDSMVSAAFRLCLRDGQCDSNCLFHMKNAATPELVADLLGCRDLSEAASITIDELPYDWTRNVQHTPRRNKVK